MTVLPHQQKGKTVVLDLGANVDLVTAQCRCNLPLWAQFWLKRWWKFQSSRGVAQYW
ncbi:hypothetical protein ACLB1S_12550 [Escherichia coli]